MPQSVSPLATFQCQVNTAVCLLTWLQHDLGPTDWIDVHLPVDSHSTHLGQAHPCGMCLLLQNGPSFEQHCAEKTALDVCTP